MDRATAQTINLQSGHPSRLNLVDALYNRLPLDIAITEIFQKWVSPQIRLKGGTGSKGGALWEDG
jgi:hypothetical protein